MGDNRVTKISRTLTMAVDARQYAPAVQRNRDAILAVLLEILPESGTILEVSSGTGEHAVYFSHHLPAHHWLPSDPNPVARASIAAWRDHSPADNLHAPIDLNAEDPIWAVEAVKKSNFDILPGPIVALTDGQAMSSEQASPTAIVNINMIHITPWSACVGLMAGASRVLPPGGVLYLYGPYKQNGVHTAGSNAAFDRGLRSQNPKWGIRDLEAVIEVAQAHQLNWLKTISMPANNLSVIFRRSDHAR
jgi:hypothetical protein